ncbi:MAG: chemotaxis protein CheB [Parvibaculum sp.]|uniref:chemotaxis protein CheB n=1 Tax=Parvibaculum sp. TaxID=2024848 RepID=UPI00272865D3|nr:chemotaxis protein CheB [Parvibaculum sp.]MDO8838892.1 chemotaxis protein CheB [Parvibaculum sp.]
MSMPGSRSPQDGTARSQPAGRAPPSQSVSQVPDDFPVVGIGASAGGLEACKKLVSALPADIGMAFILVQHLDPTHESMMVGLLAEHTKMRVQQATNGMPIERDHLYVIPPGTYLSVGDGVLHLSHPQARHGARLPFDFLLHSMAEDCGPRAVCVVLSGTGADGSLGLKSVKQKGGLVIVQDPDEAAYDGMPRSAIMTGATDQVLPVADIPDALVAYGLQITAPERAPDARSAASTEDCLPAIVELLRTSSGHDFRLYKRGTLQRRIERRMALEAIESSEMNRYFEILQNDAAELERLAKDLLINVTSFFRDPKVFEYLAEKIIPGLVQNHSLDRPLRIWVVGCSTGEEAYSLAILIQEQITAAKRNIKLEIFASDVDGDAVATARDGLYPHSIEAGVSPARLERFFSREDDNYRISPALRSSVVFTVQDVLTDPPFSRIDMISCRNLLIYLSPEAQAKAIAVFGFALRENGILLLGNAETIGHDDGRFEVISKPERIYRQVGRGSPGELGRLISADSAVRVPTRTWQNLAPSRQTVLADLCRQLVMESYAPAAVLINSKYEWLFSLGPTDRYLRVPSGPPTHNLLAMAPEDLRIKIRSAIQKAKRENKRISVRGGSTAHNGDTHTFSIEVQPVLNEGEEHLLVCFIDEPRPEPAQSRATRPEDVSRVSELEQDLASTRAELQAAIRDLEVSGEEQKAINEEAMSVNEEFQSTNEELLTAKEELQSLNEELTALNSQLQETLEQHRTTANDLQNVLYSTDVATLFLDTDLKIRFFTPATKSLFSVIPSDIGRPLSDINSLAIDNTLPADARTVLESFASIEREVEAQNDVWFIRRILPYRTSDNRVEGVVITFVDITAQRLTAKALEDARRQADLANVAKSRFLAAASHDLRQPLQTLALLQGLLAKKVKGESEKKLIARLDATITSMSSMLNTLLDLNQIEAGTVRPVAVNVRIDDLFSRIQEEFSYIAKAQDINFRLVPCSLWVHSDPQLLEQMIRNLLSNAFKYTMHGEVLLGCRRRGERLSIEVLDTGIGIAESDISKIFNEYYQVDNAARERNRGLGLGLSIVRHLGKLLKHPVRVWSSPGKGSMFCIDVPRAPVEAPHPAQSRRRDVGSRTDIEVRHTGTILVIEDDSEVRELLELFLASDGHRVVTAPDGVTALHLVARDNIQPDIVIADYNLPNGLNGLEATAKLRERFGARLPVFILTGDISTDVLRAIAFQDCLQLNKPVKPEELANALQRVLKTVAPAASEPRRAGTKIALDEPDTPIIFVVDDDGQIRDAFRELLEAEGFAVEVYADAEAFLNAYRPGREACLLIDEKLPGMDGLGLLQRLDEINHQFPAIMITGNGDVPMAVQAMKAGVADFIEKPVESAELLASVRRALERSRDKNKLLAWHEEAAKHVAGLTPRQRQIMEMVLAGDPSKNIAADLKISQRTVESHRAAIMKKTGSKSLPALARLALAAASRLDEPPADA